MLGIKKLYNYFFGAIPGYLYLYHNDKFTYDPEYALRIMNFGQDIFPLLKEIYYSAPEIAHIFDIAAAAMQTEENSHCKIYFSFSNKVLYRVGFYDVDRCIISIEGFSIIDGHTMSVLVHEMAHYVMNILFSNEANPYYANGTFITLYHDSIAQTQSILVSQKSVDMPYGSRQNSPSMDYQINKDYIVFDMLKTLPDIIMELHNEESMDREYIVRYYVHLVTEGHQATDELLLPLKKYHYEVILPIAQEKFGLDFDIPYEYQNQNVHPDF